MDSQYIEACLKFQITMNYSVSGVRVYIGNPIILWRKRTSFRVVFIKIDALALSFSLGES